MPLLEASLPLSTSAPPQDRLFSPSILATAALVFSLSYLALFLPMSLRPNVYDEGLVLTAAMRVAAGQIPHRDFYTNYGPAQFYVLAGLFKVFGTSILVERLLDLLVKALITALVFVVSSVYCRRAIALAASAVTLLWLFGLFDATFGAAVIPVLLLNLIATTLLLPLFRRSVSSKRMMIAGAVTAMAALFRYDTGVGLLAVQACTILVALYLRFRMVAPRNARFLGLTLRAFVSALVPYLLGFIAVLLPPLLCYLSAAPLRPFIHDIILYPAQYYHRGRNLPFPGISPKHYDNFVIYAVIVIIALSLGYATFRLLRIRGSGGSQIPHEELDTPGFLIAFGLLALGMYLKGFVRITPVQLALAIIPSLLLLAVLIEHYSTFPRAIRTAVACLAWLVVSSAAWSVLREVKNLHLQHSSLLESASLSARGSPWRSLGDWCGTRNPLTTVLCFLPDDDRIHTIEFIASHTRGGQKLFVGLTSHQAIYANDNLIYFATQLLPATHWSHFDPDLQSRRDIQEQIIHELDFSVPPYIVRDSEFDAVQEPNDSSKRSGITLLDDYLRSHYEPIQTFGAMTVWQRKTPVF